MSTHDSKGWGFSDSGYGKKPWMRVMSPNIKNHLVAATGEFVGTFLFLFMSFAGAHVANSQTKDPSRGIDPGGSNPPVLLYIALSFGMSLGVNVWIFYRVSGGMFNPAVTFALVMGAGLPILRALICVLAQILGGISAAAVAEAMLPGDLSVMTNLGGGTSLVQGLFIEMFLTAQLIITIFMLAVEKTKATYLAPLGIGTSLFVGHLVGIYYTGAGLNPARAFGPAVVAASFNSNHWIYWVGPFLGAVVATGLYKFLKFLDYEGANPDQDVDLSCSAKEDNSHLACTASRLRIEGRTNSLKGDIHTQSRGWSRSKESDVESGPPPSRSTIPTAAGTVRSDDMIESKNGRH